MGLRPTQGDENRGGVDREAKSHIEQRFALSAPAGGQSQPATMDTRDPVA